jgi:hypothetical protein
VTGPALRSPEDRFRALTPEQVNAAMVDDPDGDQFLRCQPRDGEELQGIAKEDQLAALYTSPFFWEFCREVFPNNNVLATGREGAPQHYPDWLLFLIESFAGVAGISTVGSSVTHFGSRKNWRNFVADVHEYVPVDMTAPHDLPSRKKRNPARPLAVAGTKPNASTVPIETHRPALARKRAHPASRPPAPHHLDYFMLRWRGLRKDGTPFPVGHPYYGLRDKAMAMFHKVGISQAHAMGILYPGNPFVYDRPDRNVFAGTDGVVMKVGKKDSPSADLSKTGVGPAHGSKFTIFSVRISGQYMSRLLLALVHNHKVHPGSYRSESDAVLDVMPELLRLSKGGIRGLLVDSAVRGYAVTALHRQGIRVVNYPHAQSNPDGKDARLNPKRVEKSQLRCTATHINHLGETCEHPIFAVGGEFMELVMTADGTDAARALEVLDYQHRVSKGVHRERLRLRIPDCAFGDGFDTMVPLFHDNPLSNDPRGKNWGEVVRLYPPGSRQFKYLYGARNDTESRHADLKARVKHFPNDVTGQELRLLGAAMAINAIAYQVHLQAHELPNVIDDTA